MALWLFGFGGSFRATVNGYQISVNSSVVTGDGVGGFVHRNGAMVFSNTYANLQEAMRDLERRATQYDFTLEVFDPSRYLPFTSDTYKQLEELAAKVAGGYVMDKADAESIRSLVSTAQQYAELRKRIVPEEEKTT